MAERRGKPPCNVVLVADDEPIVLRVITAALSNAGFRAEVVVSGNEGVAKFLERKDEICLVLADVVMPSGSGVEMARKIREVAPETKVLFMSGYSEAAQEVQAVADHPFIRKPFLPGDLVRKVQEVLETGGARAGAGLS